MKTQAQLISANPRHGQEAQRTRFSQAGFTLVELMVGILLGLITTLIVAQVLINSEGQRRTTSSGADAQVNGALALFALQRDVQMAGYGFSANPSVLGCPVKGQFDTTLVSFTLAPVVIAADATGGPDSLTVLSSSKSSFALPLSVSVVHPTSVNYFRVLSSLGAAVGDLMVAAPPAYDAANWCSLFTVTNDSSSTATTLAADNVPHTEGTSTPWNHSGATVFPAVGYPDKSTLLNLGAMIHRTYSIGAQGLQTTSMSSAGATLNTQDVYPQIVTLKALYGKDTNADGVVDTYDTTTPTTQAGWQQVLVVRVAIVARSGQYEKELVTSASPSWDVGNSGTGGLATFTCNTTSKCVTLKLGDNTDETWKHYRYKVYDTVIPLRNMLWNS